MSGVKPTLIRWSLADLPTFKRAEASASGIFELTVTALMGVSHGMAINVYVCLETAFG